MPGSTFLIPNLSGMYFQDLSTWMSNRHFKSKVFKKNTRLTNSESNAQSKHFLARCHVSPLRPQSLGKSNYSLRRQNWISSPFLPSDFYENDIQLSYACTPGYSGTRAINTFSGCKTQGKWVLRLPGPTPGVGFLPSECNSCQKAATACARNTLAAQH